MSTKICYSLPFLFNQIEENHRIRSRHLVREEEERVDSGFSGKL